LDLTKLGRSRRGLATTIASFALIGLALMPPAAAQAEPVANPTVYGPIDGGIRGYPWNHSLHELRGPGYDYTEREYFFSGDATHLATGARAPYESRMLVRLPRERADFSGTILVEWLNVTGQMDLETAWPVEAQYLMRQGIGYVGVSAQLAGVCCGPTTLKGWDPRRYGALLHPGDLFSHDLFSQAIQALRSPERNRTASPGQEPVDPVGGMRVGNVVVTGASQSARLLTTFINDGYPRGNVDVFVITRGGGPFEDFSTPIFQVNEENLEAAHADRRNYVAWEEAGTAHAPAPWQSYVARQQQRDLTLPGTPDPIDTVCSVNHGSVDYSSRAMSHWVSRYLSTGELPPPAPRVRRDASGQIVRDSRGLAMGGLRHVFVEVPVGFNTSEGCPLFGTYEPWSAAEIRELYPTHDAYLSKVRRWSGREVELGWLLPDDRRDVLEKARRFVAPWTGGCNASCPAPQGL
jgi:hypothetical protein